MSAESTGTKICPYCHEQIDDKTLVCPHCGKSVAECNYHQTAAVAICSNCGMYLCKACSKEFEGRSLSPNCYSNTVNPNSDQIAIREMQDGDKHTADSIKNKNSDSSSSGCFFTASLVFLVIAVISYLLGTVTYNEENPWGITPFIYALVISVPIAVISGIIGIIMKITAKKR